MSYQIVDDLKDVLQSSQQSGKTASRDLSLGRPNIALVLGVEAASDRLERLIALGDRMLRSLTALKPKMRFLEDLRDQLGREAMQLSELTLADATGGRR